MKPIIRPAYGEVCLGGESAYRKIDKVVFWPVERRLWVVETQIVIFCKIDLDLEEWR